MTFVVGAAAVSGLGFDWRGLGQALVRGEPLRTAVPTLPPAQDAAHARAHKLMSRSARLAAIALGNALADAGWVDDRAAIGAFFGVGASSGEIEELQPVLAAALEDGTFSLQRLGKQGLAACNPLLTFQLLNNFTLCHGAILERLGGPNAALFSRGSGTVAALTEALHALDDGDCDRAVCGGADCATHPVTCAELARDGAIRDGLIPGEGAAVLAIAARCDDPLARITRCAVHATTTRPLAEVARTAIERAAREASDRIDLVVLAPCGRPALSALRAAVTVELPAAVVVDLLAGLGDALAATPALAWVAALDLLVHAGFSRALVLSAGTDGDLGLVELARRA